jgi:hypothetical protein
MIDRRIIMMILSGYTLGFFFPKQARFRAPVADRPPSTQEGQAGSRDLNETRPDAASESREVPAAFYIHRFF